MAIIYIIGQFLATWSSNKINTCGYYSLFLPSYQIILSFLYYCDMEHGYEYTVDTFAMLISQNMFKYITKINQFVEKVLCHILVTFQKSSAIKTGNYFQETKLNQGSKPPKSSLTIIEMHRILLLFYFFLSLIPMLKRMWSIFLTCLS